MNTTGVPRNIFQKNDYKEQDCFIFVDNGFFKLVKREFESKSSTKLKFFKTIRNIAEKENCNIKKLFIYDAPPYQSKKPTEKENSLQKSYHKFKKMITSKKWINLSEGMCMRITLPNGKVIFKQKGVDALIIIDMFECVINSPEIKKMILIASDSDFVPIVEKMKEHKREVILYSYFDRIRNSKFSTSNQLLKSVSKWVQLKKEDFE